jgi:hypothetical protein
MDHKIVQIKTSPIDGFGTAQGNPTDAMALLKRRLARPSNHRPRSYRLWQPLAQADRFNEVFVPCG